MQEASEDSKAQQERTVRAFFAEVGASCVQQWQSISAVFPEPIAVMALLLERVFQQRIRNFFDETQRIASTALSPADRLRMQAACFAQAASLTEMLWQKLTPAVANSLQLGPLFQNLLGPERDLYVEQRSNPMSRGFSLSVCAGTSNVNFVGFKIITGMQSKHSVSK